MSDIGQPLAEQAFHSGFVALIGRPNVGKSTLVNACLGTKRAITSPVAQTTRKRLRAIVEDEHSQLIIVDTPGLHKPKDSLGKELNRSALSALADVDVVAFLVDATMPVGRGDEWVARHIASCNAFKLLIITKADLASPEQVHSQIEAVEKFLSFDEVIVLSATHNFNVDGFLAAVRAHIPEGPRWFAEGSDCDATDEELVAEFIREQALYMLKQEIPHSIGVICDSIFERKGVLHIEASIIVERAGQKGIVVGAGGAMVKKIGTQARHVLEKMFGQKIYLDLQVRVRPAWRKDISEIKRLGYDSRE